MDVLRNLQNEIFLNVKKKTDVNKIVNHSFTYWCLNEECIESLECFENKEKLQENCINCHIDT